ncbi:MAG TPA: DNA methyltransferase [Rhodospirillaceae bacterium]|nr:MAG: DNA methyltransferase [Alphaproteobacteria bacterium GWF2_58_20]HAU29789.1 DNA methyltransferase [Rhodospirillaceae bacterium]
MESSQNRKGPVAPVAPWMGGKSRLAKTIVARINQIPHETYAEPFVGMGGIFLRRTEPAKAEVINDLNREVATFFRVLQRHYVAFLDMMKFQLTTRYEFERLSATDPNTLTDLERAARFLYLQKTAFGGKVAGQNFGITPSSPGRFNVTRLGPMLEDLHLRLAGVVIECLPYQDFIKRYDRPGTLFYLDPPYWGCENDYGKGLFDRLDFDHMATQLGAIQGKFILSINDRPEVRRVFKGFTIEEVDTTYTIAGADKSKPVGELLISNLK